MFKINQPLNLKKKTIYILIVFTIVLLGILGMTLEQKDFKGSTEEKNSDTKINDKTQRRMYANTRING